MIYQSKRLVSFYSVHAVELNVQPLAAITSGKALSLSLAVGQLG
jgi:hypothetical protein